MQLAEWRDRFAVLGVKLAGMTYDAQSVRADFAADNALGYPLLQDNDAEFVNALGVRNVDYGPEHRFYGIPYPGILFVSPDGVVLRKFAEPGYRARPAFEDVHAGVAAAVADLQDDSDRG